VDADRRNLRGMGREGRAWGRALLTALVAAAIAGAGQLGFAYGLGIMRWDQQFVAGDSNAWRAQLTWAAWIAAVAVIGGTVAAVASLRRNGHEPHFGSWLGVAMASAVGGSLTVLLVALPARTADLPQTTDSALEAGLAAGLGTLAGVFAALAVLSARLIAGNIYATIGWVWAVALASTFGVVAGDAPLDGQGLGVLALPIMPDERPSAGVVAPMIVAIAALVSALIAAYGRWLGEHRTTVAVSGLAGPALLATAYLVAGPGTTGYLGAILAVPAGVVASVMVAVVRRPTPAPVPAPVAGPTTEIVPAARPDLDWTSEPDDWQQQQTDRVASLWGAEPTQPIESSRSRSEPVRPRQEPVRPRQEPRPEPVKATKPVKPPKPAKEAKEPKPATIKARPVKVPPPPPQPAAASVPSPRDGDYESWLTALGSDSPSDDPLLSKPKRKRGAQADQPK
jgi:hypothetical protein